VASCTRWLTLTAHGRAAGSSWTGTTCAAAAGERHRWVGEPVKGGGS
jgi:hypothetical protein